MRLFHGSATTICQGGRKISNEALLCVNAVRAKSTLLVAQKGQL